MKGEAQRLLNEIVTAIESDEFVSDKIDMLRQTLAQLDSDALVALVSRNSDGPIDWNSTVEQVDVFFINYRFLNMSSFTDKWGDRYNYNCDILHSVHSSLRLKCLVQYWLLKH